MEKGKLFPAVLLCLICLFGGISCTVESLVEADSDSEFPAGVTEQVKVSVKDYIISDMDHPEETKTTLTFGGGVLDFSWAVTDTIGIFPNSARAQIPFPMAAGVGTKQALFDGGGWFVEGGSSYMAYYPFDGRMYHKNSTISASFQSIVQCGNNSTEHLGKYDFMGVRAVGSNDKNISFAFDHLGTVLIFYLTVPKATTYTKLTLETNERVFVLKGGINLLAQVLGISPISTSKTYSMALSGVHTTAPNQQLTIYVPMAAVNLSGKTITLRLTGPNVNYSHSFQLNAAFQPGHAYQKTITFNSTGTVSKIVPGTLFNTMVKTFVAGEDRTLEEFDYAIHNIVFQPNNEEVLDLPRIDISDVDSSVPIYAYWKADENKLIIRSEQAIYAAADCEKMFYRFGGMQGINLTGLDLYYTRTLESVFRECTQLLSVDLTPVNTQYVTDFERMFMDCHSLVSIDLSTIDTSGMDSMEEMFRDCQSLASLDLSSFITDKLWNMAGAFQVCNHMTSITFGSNFHTDKVTRFDWTFAACQLLPTLDLSGFDTSSGNDFSQMFLFCDNLETITGDFEITGNAKSLFRMFERCGKLEALDVSQWNTSNITNMSGAFNGCSSLTTLAVSRWDVSKSTEFRNMFQGCSGITSLDLSRWDTSACTSMEAMFRDCDHLTALDLDIFATDNVTNMAEMFQGCHDLATLSLANFNTARVTSMESMFWECRSLTTLNLATFKTSNVLTMSQMFKDCTLLESITFNPATFDTHRVQSMYGMFWNCTHLVGLDLSFFNTERVRNMQRLFECCSSLVSLDISGFKATAMEEGCESFLAGCEKLATIDFGPYYAFPNPFTDAGNYMDNCGKEIASGTIHCSTAMQAALGALVGEGFGQWKPAYRNKYTITTY